ncbi:YczE/YyaS/YitT family protein [Psychrobacillus vulpis]|uniref:YitT family protein n=1 Tax=Psychrobacillus vulpis TaxID=2325572 RepID=A0A544TTM3_9BACI|nr:YitT family protein [Psychrobacillus vulpis]TQR20788.1 YitT family protein [Psychrobacillus vulpis]
MKKELIWRWTFFIGGVLLMALGISMTIKGQRFGIAPWDVLHVGLYKHLGLSIGAWAILTGIIIVVATTIGTKRMPQLGTWLNILVIGSFIDVFNWLIPDITSFAGQLTIFLLGLVVMAIGVGVYVSPNVGAGPRDSLMLLIVAKKGWSIKTVRTGIEVIVAVVGWILGGPVGIGTVMTALLLGQLVHYTMPMSQKLLHNISGYSQPFTKMSAENQE